MLTPIDHGTWQVLRAALRHVRRTRKPCPGWRLRLTPTRRNKSGQFLTDMVEAGLLEVVPGNPSPPPADAEVTEAVREPGPFHLLYAVTARGRHAAEYGEHDANASYNSSEDGSV